MSVSAVFLLEDTNCGDSPQRDATYAPEIFYKYCDGRKAEVPFDSLEKLQTPHCDEITNPAL
jgi:hypothetical protein